MKLPYILLVDDDIQVLRAIQRDVRSAYREEYKVAAAESALDALELIKELKLKNETVALFISDQRMPEMEGVSFLEQANAIFPEAKKVLLTAYSDTMAAIRAINDVKLDYYLFKALASARRKNYFPSSTTSSTTGMRSTSPTTKPRASSVFNGRRSRMT
jgi:thioredoxin reductase (NADPH)